MALNNYSNLKAAIINLSHRTDISDIIDDLIDLTESDYKYELKIRDMEVRSTASASTADQFLQLPTSFVSMRRLKIKQGGIDYDVRYSNPESMQTVKGSGRPKYFTVTSQLEFDRVPDSAYTLEMQYYKEITALSSSNTTNAVLTRFPKIYVHGCLYNLYSTWAREENRAEYHRSLFEKAITDANKLDKKGRHGSAPAIKTEGSTP